MYLISVEKLDFFVGTFETYQVLSYLIHTVNPSFDLMAWQA